MTTCDGGRRGFYVSRAGMSWVAARVGSMRARWALSLGCVWFAIWSFGGGGESSRAVGGEARVGVEKGGVADEGRLAGG